MHFHLELLLKKNQNISRDGKVANKRHGGHIKLSLRNMKHTDLFNAVQDKLGGLREAHGMSISIQGDLDDPRGIGITLQNQDIQIFVSRDHGHEHVEVNCLTRPRPRAHLRGYSVKRLKAYLDGKMSADASTSLREDLDTLLKHYDKFLDPAFLNSEDLRLWNVDAARIMFGEKPRNRKKRTNT
jgi:hypothetical protein